MRALVTGGAGFIGSHLVPALLGDGAEVLIVDDMSVGEAMPEPGERVTPVVAPLGSRRAEGAIAEFAPDTVFHLAALHFIPWCERNPAQAHRANVEGTAWLLDVLHDVDPARLLFASSVAVYGFADEPLTESASLRPGGVYAETKVVGEDLVRQYAAAHPRRTVALPRFANVYGRGDPNDHLVPALCRDLGGEIHVGNLWPRRDYVHVTDVVRALLAMAALPAGVHALNVSTGVGTTVDTIVTTLAELAGVPTSIVCDPARRRAGDGHLVADPSALRRATGWCARVGLRAGLADVLASVRHDTGVDSEFIRA